MYQLVWKSSVFVFLFSLYAPPTFCLCLSIVERPRVRWKFFSLFPNQIFNVIWLTFTSQRTFTFANTANSRVYVVHVCAHMNISAPDVAVALEYSIEGERREKKKSTRVTWTQRLKNKREKKKKLSISASEFFALILISSNMCRMLWFLFSSRCMILFTANSGIYDFSEPNWMEWTEKFHVTVPFRYLSHWSSALQRLAI